ncbi:plasmid pRiA4b ORF-3 family protein [Burkholderia plantarii]|uniref:plasmid pRiA4b ORF-3 family protein n=1 Tax=Burkholderia plantarii TaxID=41899 RepID=UPI0034E26E46
MAKSFQRFTLHVQLQHIGPPIWRRLEVEGTESLRKLHHILQAAFGWEDSHLHDFLIDGMTYAMFEVDDVLDFADPGTTADDRKVRLQKVLKPGSRFLYRYDFGYCHPCRRGTASDRPVRCSSMWMSSSDQMAWRATKIATSKNGMSGYDPVNLHNELLKGKVSRQQGRHTIALTPV